MFSMTPVFILVLCRVAGIMVFAPVLGSTVIPIKIKGLIALVMSIAVFPMVMQSDAAALAAEPSTFFGLAMGVALEMVIGVAMGFALLLLFVGIQLGAEMISQQMALSLGRIIDPITNISTDVVSQFYLMLTTLIYVLINGPLILIRALFETFRSIPLMGAGVDERLVGIFTSILTSSFTLGIRIAGPALAAIFLATLAMGFISRTMPQLNILAAGFPLRITMALILLIASLGSVCLLIEDKVLKLLSGLGGLFV
jgi:flagellar biosynthetic protein FliR